jgi:leader peptidase (prepilin peptidase) / N-methyltransferase
MVNELGSVLWGYVVVAGLLGLVVGSAINALVWRLYVGRSWVHGRSECPECGHRLAPKDLVPVVSWLLLRGRCRYCRKPIKDHPVVELACGIVFALSTYVVAPAGALGWVRLGLWLAAATILLALAVYDVRWMILPDKLTWPLIGLALLSDVIMAILLHGPRLALGPVTAAVLAGGGFFAIVAGSRGRAMGGGDIKLAAAMGLLLGLKGTVVAMVLAFNCAAIVGVTLIAMRRRGRRDQIPFGPFLVFGTLVAMWFTQPLVAWYLRLSGAG